LTENNNEKPTCDVIGVEFNPKSTSLLLHKENCDWLPLVNEPLPSDIMKEDKWPSLKNLKRCNLYVGHKQKLLAFTEDPEDFNKRQMLFQSLRPKQKYKFPNIDFRYNKC
jgi:hypothetical protein